MAAKTKGKRLLKLLGVFLLIVIGLMLTQYHSDIPIEELQEKYTNLASKFIDIDGMPVHYRDEGQGKTVILIHGTAASLHTWDVWTTKLLKEGFRVVRMDLPAFGLTGPNKEHDYSIDQYTKFLEKFRVKMNIESCYLVGNSLGGRIAWNYAADFPNHIEKLILVDASGFKIQNPDGSEKTPPLAFRLAQSNSLKWVVRYFTPKFLVRKSLREVIADDRKITEEQVRRYHDFMLREGNRDAFIARVKTNFADETHKLNRINIPTLIMWGKLDEWVPVSLAYQFEKLLPNSELIIYDNLGHIPMEESPEKTVKDAVQFMNKPLINIQKLELGHR